jgi:hypothetical protein
LRQSETARALIRGLLAPALSATETLSPRR